MFRSSLSGLSGPVAKIAAAAMLACGSMAVSAAPVPTGEFVDLSGVGYFTYGNVNSYLATELGIASGPGQIQNGVVIYTGSSGGNVTTNGAGFDSAYGAIQGAGPNATTDRYASIGQGIADPVATPGSGISNNDPNTWDASLTALQTYLNGGNPLFLFNNNDTGGDPTLAIWAKLWITTPTNQVYNNRYLYLSNRGLSFGTGGVENGDATTYNPGNVLAPLAADPTPLPVDNLGSTDYVLAGAPVNGNNLGNNAVDYAGDVPLLNQWLQTLFAASPANLSQYTFHLDVRLGCENPAFWGGTCRGTGIDNGPEQLFLFSSVAPNVVPEPGSAALAGLMLAGLALGRRRQSR